MQFKSKTTRYFWLNTILNHIPDILIALIVTHFSSTPILAFFLMLIGLQVLYLLIWLKNSLWSWFLYLIIGKKQMVNFLFDFLKENKFPEPETYLSSATEYLNTIVMNNLLSTDLRLIAAAELGGLNTYRGQFQIQLHLRICMAYEDAVEQYKRTFG